MKAIISIYYFFKVNSYQAIKGDELKKNSSNQLNTLERMKRNRYYGHFEHIIQMHKIFLLKYFKKTLILTIYSSHHNIIKTGKIYMITINTKKFKE